MGAQTASHIHRTPQSTSHSSCAALTNLPVPILALDAVENRLIAVPAPDTAPVVDPSPCDCNNANPVYDCADTALNAKACAWSWDLPPNGAPDTGLYLGSRTNGITIAARNNILSPTDAAMYYTDTRAPNISTLNATSTHGITNYTLPSICAPFPFGHTHPALYPENTSTLFPYCKKAYGPDHNKYAYCDRDRRTQEQRHTLCTRTDINIVVAGKVWPHTRTSPCNGSTCLYVHGDPQYPTIDSVLDHGPHNPTLIISPISYKVLRGFKIDPVCTDITTNTSVPCGTRLTDAQFNNLLSVDPGPTLLTLHTAAKAYTTTTKSLCDVPIIASDGIAGPDGTFCGTSADLHPTVPYGTIVTHPFTSPSSLVTHPCTPGACDRTLTFKAAVSVAGNISTTGTVRIETGPFTVNDTLEAAHFVAENGNTPITINTLSAHTAAFAAWTNTVNVTHTAHLTNYLVLSKWNEPPTRFTGTTGIEEIDLSALTGAFGTAVEHSIYRRPPDHTHTLVVIIVVEVGITLAVILLFALYAEHAHNNKWKTASKHSSSQATQHSQNP